MLTIFRVTLIQTNLLLNIIMITQGNIELIDLKMLLVFSYYVIYNYNIIYVVLLQNVDIKI